jgi:aryl sulfotransferase
MQGIVSSLLWPVGDAPGNRHERSPWIDARFTPVDDLLAHVDQQPHRRFIKTHSPADCTPIFENCKYITVYRDGRDALMSWGNHRSKMRPMLIDFLNSTAEADGIEPMSRQWSGDTDELLDEWEALCSSVTHLASWWPMRTEPFVYFVHYNDLKADLAGEMRRLAEYLEIEVPDAHWPEVVERCGLAQMRDHADNDQMEMVFEGGASAFFFQGTNGRWRDVLTDAQLQRYDRLVAEGLPDDAAQWLEHGSLALGQRPRASDL